MLLVYEKDWPHPSLVLIRTSFPCVTRAMERIRVEPHPPPQTKHPMVAGLFILQRVPGKLVQIWIL